MFVCFYDYIFGDAFRHSTIEYSKLFAEPHSRTLQEKQYLHSNKTQYRDNFCM